VVALVIQRHLGDRKIAGLPGPPAPLAHHGVRVVLKRLGGSPRGRVTPLRSGGLDGVSRYVPSKTSGSTESGFYLLTPARTSARRSGCQER